ncbi:uncharacterized protein LOC129595167 isoform X2 [Paramacrobiotus metropolitanus]|uniref:uncharacterized protein LOC129595167 isoform X2 n=1 Tax=Paramacrobiotus metropolitanus TaxID=2943436 RepID=UPI002445B12B|nr:uncharacterized protein LOC129595167 isoform X2 [Paramacrobiotus metropolitanus]
MIWMRRLWRRRWRVSRRRGRSGMQRGRRRDVLPRQTSKGDAETCHPSKTHVTLSKATLGGFSRGFNYCQDVDATTKEVTFEGGASDRNDGWLLHCTLGILFGKDIHLDKLTLSKTYPIFGDIVENTEDTLKINARLAAVAQKPVIRECKVSQFIYSVKNVSSGLVDTEAVVEEAELELHGEDAVSRALTVFEEVVEEVEERLKERLKKGFKKYPEKSVKILKKWEPKRFCELKEADLKSVVVSSLKKLTQMAILYTFL